jgi:hypothetical protein
MSRTRLSPTAAEFNYSSPATWNASSGFGQLGHAGQGATNANNNSLTAYSALNVNANNAIGSFNGNPGVVPESNWKQLVEKIVHAADQQSSILMQQKIKIVDTSEKYRMCEAILGHCYTLMINRFGNFLVQRVLEHGTADQIMAVANTIRGHVVSLSMDPFGCHVVQKALDIVPEEYKAAMVHELLRRIPDTVIHRYACHVWQKLFELRWSDSPPQIMRYVNDALSGMWHEVALGETGSLVVQNIFENCLEEDKVSALP